jgi:hypothetical protein
VWTSVRGRGTSGCSDAPTFVPGRSAARTGAVQICLATFDQVFFPTFAIEVTQGDYKKVIEQSTSTTLRKAL